MLAPSKIAYLVCFSSLGLVSNNIIYEGGELELANSCWQTGKQMGNGKPGKPSNANWLAKLAGSPAICSKKKLANLSANARLLLAPKCFENIINY